MELMYQSTRSEGTKVTASQAILKGLADDGGLFVPVSIPKLDVSLEDISKMTYQETAYEVMKLFFTDFTENELKTCIERAYDSKFDTKEIAPLVKKSDAHFQYCLTFLQHQLRKTISKMRLLYLLLHLEIQERLLLPDLQMLREQVLSYFTLKTA